MRICAEKMKDWMCWNGAQHNTTLQGNSCLDDAKQGLSTCMPVICFHSKPLLMLCIFTPVSCHGLSHGPLSLLGPLPEIDYTPPKHDIPILNHLLFLPPCSTISNIIMTSFSMRTATVPLLCFHPPMPGTCSRLVMF